MFADLSGKTALVTGGSQGLGLGIVNKMVGQGAAIIIADINELNAAAVAADLRAGGASAWSVRMDVTKPDEIRDGVAESLRQAQKIDILVNNAGIAGTPSATGTSFTDADWEITWRVNVKGLANVTEAVLPHMQKHQYGKIINISSVAARAARYATGYYGTTKMAVIAYTQALAREFAKDNINVNAIAPGRIWTAFHQNWISNREKVGDATVAGKDRYSVFEDAAREVIPLGRPQTPEDIGALATFLASEEARNITGQTIQCDGGQVMV